MDDEPINLQVVTNYLSLENYDVIPAANGKEALEMIGNGFRPDLILLDVMMPKMSGYQVCQKNPPAVSRFGNARRHVNGQRSSVGLGRRVGRRG